MSDTVPHGRFVWYELSTSDRSAVQSFYTQRTGWCTKEGAVSRGWRSPPRAHALNCIPTSALFDPGLHWK